MEPCRCTWGYWFSHETSMSASRECQFPSFYAASFPFHLSNANLFSVDVSFCYSTRRPSPANLSHFDANLLLLFIMVYFSDLLPVCFSVILKTFSHQHGAHNNSFDVNVSSVIDHLKKISCLCEQCNNTQARQI